MNKILEIQNRYAEVLANCYELYQHGRKCLFEGLSDKSYNCSNCTHSTRNQFCKANSLLKKLIVLLAEGIIAEGHRHEDRGAVRGMQEGYVVGEEDAAGIRTQGAPITDEHIKSFKALNIAVALSSPKVQETIWLVPEHTGRPGLELTPEDIRILEAAVTNFNGEIIEAKRINNPKTQI